MLLRMSIGLSLTPERCEPGTVALCSRTCFCLALRLSFDPIPSFFHSHDNFMFRRGGEASPRVSALEPRLKTARISAIVVSLAFSALVALFSSFYLSDVLSVIGTRGSYKVTVPLPSKERQVFS